MRALPLLVHGLFASVAVAQYDEFSGRFNYAFIEDSSALVPLKGAYQVEYLGRGRLWSYMDPRTPVDYPGERKPLKQMIAIGKATLMLVELGKDYLNTDQKLRVVRGRDTMIVDLNGYGYSEELMRARTANVGGRPRPPVLVPFRKGWFDLRSLVTEPPIPALTERYDALWKAERTTVLALFDTARYEFSLETDGLRVGPLQIPIMRDPNYETHLLHFPPSGPGTHFELYRQDSLGVTDAIMSLRVDMPANGETGQWVDITHLPYGKYTTHLLWGDNRSTFYLIFGW